MRRMWLCMILLLLAACKESETPTLHIFSWSEMLDPGLIHDFENAFHCKVVVDLYDSNESMYAKVRLGNSSYDILFPSNYYLEIMSKQGMIRPLDFERIPNHVYLDPHYFTVEKNPYGIPFMVSYSGIGYRTDKVELTYPSYTIFGARRYSGRMTMLSDAREALGAALKTLGASVNTRDKHQIHAAADLLIDWKKNLAKFENEQYKNGLINSEFLVCQAYSSDILQVRSETEHVSFGFPKEGSILSIEYVTISQRAPQAELAHAFINYMIAPQAASLNIQRTHALTPVPESYPLLPKHLRESPTLFPTKEQIDAMESIQDLGSDAHIYYEAWERVRGS